MSDRITGDGPNPSGLCMCGCGQRTSLAPQSSRSKGWVAGKPICFVLRHHARNTSGPEYVVDPETGCWLWQRSIGDGGYGYLSVGGHVRKAHVVYYERANGPVPAGLELDHICRNRRCVNPEHLDPVTHAVNMQRGKNTKLTQKIADDIRAEIAAGSSRASQAEKYGVHIGTIHLIVAGKTWLAAARIAIEKEEGL